MTEQQFADWQNYHTALFRGFGDWMLGINAKGPSEDQRVVQLREEAWLKALSPYEVDDVKGASYRLWQMPVSDRPTAYSDHLSALLEVVRRLRERPESSQKIVRCDRCGDTGVVEATAKPGMCLFTLHRKPLSSGTYAAVDCDCTAAVWYSEECQTPRRDRWDSSRMLPRPKVDFERSYELIAEMREKGEHRKANAWEEFLNGGVLPTWEMEVVE